MTFTEFKASLEEAAPPPHLPLALQALWWEGKGHWDRSHDVAQDLNSAEGSWIHAYLHRKEGDTGNAGYWYARAGKKMPEGSSTVEWEQIAKTLLGEDAR